MKTLLLLAAATVLYGGEVKLDTIRPTSVVAFTGLPDADIQVIGAQALKGEPGATVEIIEGRGAQCENEALVRISIPAGFTWTFSPPNIPNLRATFLPLTVPRGNTICVRTTGTVSGVKLFWR